MNKYLQTVVKAVLFVLFVGLVMVGQRNVGYAGLAVMMVGLTGLLVLLWDYNRKYQ